MQPRKSEFKRCARSSAMWLFLSLVQTVPAQELPDIKKYNPLQLTGHSKEVITATFSPDGKRIATGGKDYTVRIWDTSSGKQLLVLNGHTAYIRGVHFSRDGRKLISVSDDDSIRIWDVSTGKLLRFVTKNRGGTISSFAVSPNGETLAAVFHGARDKPNHVRAWNLKTGKMQETARHPSHVGSIVFLNNTTVITGSYDQIIRFWDLPSGKQTRAFRDPHHKVLQVTLTPDGKKLYSGGGEESVLQKAGELWEWDLSTGKQKQIAANHTNLINCMAVNPDGTILATGDGVGLVRLRSTKTGKQLAAVQVDFLVVGALHFSPDGKLLLTCGTDPRAFVWKVKDLLRQR